MSKLKFWLVPLIIFVFLAITVATTAFLFHKTQKDNQIEKAIQISTLISKNMSREIEYRLQALKVVSENVRKAPNQTEFESLAKSLQNEYTGFFAINYVSPDGIIRRVHPLPENKAAEGQNLLERDDVAPYLIESKKFAAPRVSHRILTYQKIYAVVLYVPLYGKANNFLGWMNGVLSIDDCLNYYMKDESLKNIHARVRWLHPSDTNTLSYKWNNSDSFHTTKHKIMNQILEIDIAVMSSLLDLRHNSLYVTTVVLRITLLLVISFLIILLAVSRFKLNVANEQLSFKDNMLNSLTHDISSPITALNLTLHMAMQKAEFSESSRQKIDVLFKTIEGMLKSVRLLHSYGIGVKSIPIENVPALKALEEAIIIVEQSANTKNIRFEISPTLDNNLVLQANAHTLVNNVFVNVLTNAIKFSSREGVVHINHSLSNNQVNLIFTNYGTGLSDIDLAKFKQLSRIETRLGTTGEQGTGLGLLQITGFMKIYGGQVNLENITPTGVKTTLTFEKA